MIFLYFHNGKLCVNIMNKEVSNVDDFYLILNSNYGHLVGYKFHQKFDFTHLYVERAIVKTSKVG